MEPVEIKQKQGVIFLCLIACIILLGAVVFECSVLAGASSKPVVWLGVIPAALLLLPVIFMLIFYFMKPKTVLNIYKNGFYTPEYDFVPWSNVEDIYSVQPHGGPENRSFTYLTYINVDVKDKSSIKAKLPIWNILPINFNPYQICPGLAISLALTGRECGEVIKIMKEYKSACEE